MKACITIYKIKDWIIKITSVLSIFMAKKEIKKFKVDLVDFLSIILLLKKDEKACNFVAVLRVCTMFFLFLNYLWLPIVIVKSENFFKHTKKKGTDPMTHVSGPFLYDICHKVIYSLLIFNVLIHKIITFIIMTKWITDHWNF